MTSEGDKWLKYSTDYILELYKEVESKRRVYKNAKEFIDNDYTLDSLLEEINDKERVLAYAIKVRNEASKALDKIDED